MRALRKKTPFLSPTSGLSAERRKEVRAPRRHFRPLRALTDYPLCPRRSVARRLLDEHVSFP